MHLSSSFFFFFLPSNIPETPHFRYIAIFRYRREVTSETSAIVCQAGIFRFLLDIKVSFRPRFQLSTGRDFRLTPGHEAKVIIYLYIGFAKYDGHHQWFCNLKLVCACLLNAV